MGRLRSPIHWFGSKNRMANNLLKLMPPHKHYAEPFGGSAALLFAKPRCVGVETYNDVDDGLVNFFRVLRDPNKFGLFYHRSVMTLFSRLRQTQSRTEVVWRNPAAMEAIKQKEPSLWP